MMRFIGSVGVLLAGLGLAVCVAGIIALWWARPVVLRSSGELFDAADGGLQLVEEKAARADELVKRVRRKVEPVTAKIRHLAIKAERTPEDEQELKRIEAALMDRLHQVDAIAEIAESAVAFANKSARLTRTLPLRRKSDADNDLDERLEALNRVSAKLKELRAAIAKLREDKAVQKEIIDLAVRVAREVDEELQSVETRIQRLRERTTEVRAEAAELRDAVAFWTNTTAIAGSLILLWMGLGQLALLSGSFLQHPVSLRVHSRLGLQTRPYLVLGKDRFRVSDVLATIRRFNRLADVEEYEVILDPNPSKGNCILKCCAHFEDH